MLRWLARRLLWALNLVVPVFIAACYGAQFGDEYGPSPGRETSHRGKTIDGRTQEGIHGILVTCLRGGLAWSTDHTDLDGTFYLWDRCDQLRFDDVDGPENGGPYVTRIVTVDPNCPEITVELHD
jgi:hypothetical protein